jgi:hypothetical protein
MFNFYKKKYSEISYFAVGIVFSVLMFQIFAHVLLLKTKNFELSYLYKKVNYTNTFRKKKKTILALKFFIIYVSIK